MLWLEGDSSLFILLATTESRFAREEDILLGAFGDECGLPSLRMLEEEELLKNKDGEDDLPLGCAASSLPASSFGLLSLRIAYLLVLLASVY